MRTLGIRFHGGGRVELSLLWLLLLWLSMALWSFVPVGERRASDVVRSRRVAFSATWGGRGPFLHQRLQLHGAGELRPRVTRRLPPGGTSASAQIQPVWLLGLRLRRFPISCTTKLYYNVFITRDRDMVKIYVSIF